MLRHVRSIASPPFAYGATSFSSLRRDRSFFVDTTRHIALLEPQRHVLLARPPRFGKSLFLDTMATYYDVLTSPGEFDQLFGGLEAHATVTPLARSFHVLRIDLSANARPGSCDLSDQLNKALLDFRSRYDLQFWLNPHQDELVGLQSAAAAVKQKNGKLFVFIDEYDHSVMKWFKPWEDAVKRVCRVLVALKEIGAAQDVRTFLTGVLPVALVDADGRSLVEHVTHAPGLASLAGFRAADLERALTLIPHLSAAQRDGALALMRKWYGAHWFQGAAEPLYNPTQALFLLCRLASGKLDVDALLAMDAAGSERTLAHHLTDTSVRPLHGFFSRVRDSQPGERALAQLHSSAPFAVPDVAQVFKIAHDSFHSARDTQALMFYVGAATFNDATGSELRVANELFRQIRFAPVLKPQYHDVDTLLRAPTKALFEALLAEVATVEEGNGSHEQEATLTYRFGLVLSSLCRPRGIELVMPAASSASHVVLLHNDAALVIALKNINVERQQFDRLSAKTEDELLSLHKDAGWSYRAEPKEVRTVAQILLETQIQAAEHAATLRATGRVGAETPVHAWVIVPLVYTDRCIIRAAADRATI